MAKKAKKKEPRKRTITKSVVERFLAEENSVNLSEFDTIKDDAAEILAQHKGDLNLNGLKEMPEKARRWLRMHHGGVYNKLGFYPDPILLEENNLPQQSVVRVEAIDASGQFEESCQAFARTAGAFGSLLISKKGDCIYVGNVGLGVSCYDLATGEHMHSFGHYDPATELLENIVGEHDSIVTECLSFNTSESLIAMSGYGKHNTIVRVFSTNDRLKRCDIKVDFGTNFVSWCGDDDLLASCRLDYEGNRICISSCLNESRRDYWSPPSGLRIQNIVFSGRRHELLVLCRGSDKEPNLARICRIQIGEDGICEAGYRNFDSGRWYYSSLACSPVKNLAAVCQGGDPVEIVSLDDLSVLFRLEPPAEPHKFVPQSASFSACGEKLAVKWTMNSSGGWIYDRISIYDLENRQIIKNASDYNKHSHLLSFTPNGESLISAGELGIFVTPLNASATSPEHSHIGAIRKLSLLNEGTCIASVGTDGRVCVGDTRKSKTHRCFDLSTILMHLSPLAARSLESINDVAYSESNHSLYVTTQNYLICIDEKAESVRWIIDSNGGSWGQVRSGQANNLLATRGVRTVIGESVSVWCIDALTGKLMDECIVRIGDCLNVCLSGSGDTAVALSEGGAETINLVTGCSVNIIPGAFDRLSKDSVVSLNGNILVCNVGENVESWCLDSGSMLARWRLHGQIANIALSIDGRRSCVAESKAGWSKTGWTDFHSAFEFIEYDTKSGQELCRRSWQGVAFGQIACVVHADDMFWTPSRTYVIENPLSSTSSA